MEKQAVKETARDETWYVAIVRGAGGANSFIAAGGESYRDYAKYARKYGMGIIAERFGVDDATVNRLTGFDENGKRVSEGGVLKDLVDRINSEKQLNAQEELDKLCDI